MRCIICGQLGHFPYGPSGQFSLCTPHEDKWWNWHKRRAELLGNDFESKSQAEQDALWVKCFQTFAEEIKNTP